MIRWLNCPIVIPEGVTVIRNGTFDDCRSLAIPPILPNSLKKIEGHAFANTRFAEIDFKDGLEYIGQGAFQACGLTRVNIPASIVEVGAMAFQLSDCIEEVVFPDNMETISMGLFSYCAGLKRVSLPSSCKVIDNSAFMWCPALSHISFPENLESICKDAFYGCPFDTIVFPSSIKSLGSGSFTIPNIEVVYCHAEYPPVCEKDPQSGYAPFSKKLVANTILCVPVGSAERYRNEWGWDFFQNIKESDDFPSTGILKISADNRECEEMMFDLTGRRVYNPLSGSLYIRNGKKFIYR